MARASDATCILPSSFTHQTSATSLPLVRVTAMPASCPIGDKVVARSTRPADAHRATDRQSIQKLVLPSRRGVAAARACRRYSDGNLSLVQRQWRRHRENPRFPPFCKVGIFSRRGHQHPPKMADLRGSGGLHGRFTHPCVQRMRIKRSAWLLRSKILAASSFTFDRYHRRAPPVLRWRVERL